VIDKFLVNCNSDVQFFLVCCRVYHQQ